MRTPTVHKFLQQSMESDLDFISRLAAGENCEVGVEDGQGLPAAAEQRQRRRAHGRVAQEREVVQAARERLPATRLGQGVELRAADEEGDRRRGHGAERRPKVAQEARDKGKKFGSSELLVADKIAHTTEEAKLIAQSTLDKLASGSFEGEGVMDGNPRGQGRRQAQARGLRLVRRGARAQRRDPRLRPWQLPHALHDQRPQPAHAHRRDAPPRPSATGRRAWSSAS